MPGSRNPEKDTDQQCMHCGLWFSPQGITNHEPNCQLKDFDTVIEPIVDGAGESVDDVEGPSDPVDQDDAVETTDPPLASDGGSPAMAAPEPDPDAGTGTVEDPKDSEPETVDCPSCQSDTGADPSELEDGKVYRCTDCSSKWRWSDE